MEIETDPADRFPPRPANGMITVAVARMRVEIREPDSQF
jgi:hypothetical protein